MNILLYPIILPFIIGIFCLLTPKKVRETLVIIGSLLTFGLTVWFFFGKIAPDRLPTTGYFRFDSLSSFVLLAIGLFGFLITLYSLKYMAGKNRLREYYTYLLWTIGASSGVVLANNLILLLVFWGFLGLTLYLLIGIGGQRALPAAKKAFIIVGGSDALMLLGIILIWLKAGPETSIFSLPMDGISIPLVGGVAIAAYLCLAIASFAKAGAMPFHTWIPDMAETAPLSVTAFLPASLDKLLGIYLLARISLNLFVMNQAMGLVLLIVGAVTIIAAVMMALVQHDLKRLLGYHAVSQVGYMVLGIGTGNPIGIAGGLFHMLNNVIYKQGLFLAGGAVEKRVGTSDLDKLGGLARVMPITFVTFLIAALSISGIPPFNGFVSKWMIYQGVIEVGAGQGLGARLWIIWLIAAMFGSALTLASFMKLIYAIFLGQRAKELARKRVKEVSWTMWLPMGILAGLCVIFGVFAYRTALKIFILPVVPGVSFLGVWSPGLATLLIIIGLAIGAIIYWLGNLRKSLREDASYVGGEVLPAEVRVTGVDFYNTIKDFALFKVIYKKAEEKLFDIYDLGRNFVFIFTKGLQRIHTGVLTTYFSWILIGLVVLLFLLMR
ncbi:MAG TPA: NADH-quinone oxidoreductase subunit L [bacterium]|nr:NADH-quinone oxidoreductase subunit L [bacterium]